MHKPKIHRPFLTLLQLSFKHYFSVVKVSWPFILLLVLIKDLNQLVSYTSGFFSLDLAINALIGFLLLFCWCCSLRATDNFWRGHVTSFAEVFRYTLRLAPSIFLGALGFVVIFAIFFMFAHAVIKGSLLFEFILFLLPVLFLFVLFYFTIPIIILHKSSPITAFRKSAEIVGFQHWLPSFGLYALTLFTCLLVSPSSLHEHILAIYYLNTPFDFLILLILIPMINSMIVLFENDFKQVSA